jgi:hypothetical protein
MPFGRGFEWVGSGGRLHVARLDQGAQGLIDGVVVLKVSAYVWIEHDGSIGKGEVLGFGGAVFFVDGDGVALSVGLVMFAAHAVGEVVLGH